MTADLSPIILDGTTKVLIVDDSTQYASVLQKMLKHLFGLTEVTPLTSTESALTKLESESIGAYPLIFVDYRFPSGMNGCDLLEAAAAKGLLTKSIFFLMTSEPTSDNAKRATKVGASGVLAKPFDRADLERQIRLALRLRTQGAEPEL